MELISNKAILDEARRRGYAVGAFNVYNAETIQAVAEAAEEERSPVIIAVSGGAVEYFGADYMSAVAKAAARRMSVPVSLHLDHGESLDIILLAIREGFTSVMIDASDLDFDGNVEATRRVAELAHPLGISVEGELGTIKGIEEGVKEGAEASFLTDPSSAAKFVELTGVDALAVAIGTAHGAYKFKGEPKLDFDRLNRIREKANVPLVLHGASGVSQLIVQKAAEYGADWSGASGVPDEAIRKAIQLGICKINIATDLRLAYICALREALWKDPKTDRPTKIEAHAREAVKEVVKVKMRLFGSSGKA